MKLPDLDMFEGYEPEDDWASFRGIHLGSSCVFDDIVYATTSPVSPLGSIIAFCPDLSGPAGTGEHANIPGSLVLAKTPRAGYIAWSKPTVRLRLTRTPPATDEPRSPPPPTRATRNSPAALKSHRASATILAQPVQSSRIWPTITVPGRFHPRWTTAT